MKIQKEKKGWFSKTPTSSCIIAVQAEGKWGVRLERGMRSLGINLLYKLGRGFHSLYTKVQCHSNM